MKKSLFFILITILTIASSAAKIPSKSASVKKTSPSSLNLVDQTTLEKESIPFMLFFDIQYVDKEKKSKSHEIMVKNELKTNAFHKSRFHVPANSLLSLKVTIENEKGNKKDYKAHWQIVKQSEKRDEQIKDDTQTIQKDYFKIPIDFIDKFTIHMMVFNLDDELITKNEFRFQVDDLPMVSIVEPATDQVKEYRQKIRLVANALDGVGNIPLIIWINKNEYTKRVLGVGGELKTSHLDFGNNEICAIAVDWRGKTMISDPVSIMVPTKVTTTKIILPKNNQKYRWNQPIMIYAIGNKLSYALDEEKFQRGSGVIKSGLLPGEHLITFKGKYGEASHRFIVGEKVKIVARFTRVDGTVLKMDRGRQWKTVKTGDEIQEGYIIKAVGKGIAEIHLNSGIVFVLDQSKTIRILPGGSIEKNIIEQNINQADLALYSIVDSQQISDIVNNLKPMIKQLEIMLETHEITQIKAENEEDVQDMMKMIFKGDLKIDELMFE